MANEGQKLLVIVFDDDLAKDIVDEIVAQQPGDLDKKFIIKTQNASTRPKNLLDLPADSHVIFILQTIENASPTENGGTSVRFFKRKTHPENLLEGKFEYSVLGLGDSNLLLDRQTTTAKDCNQVAIELDGRLEKLGGKRFYELGLADEREGLPEVKPWITGLWANLSKA